MTHELLESRQGDAGGDHVGAEGVAKAMGIGLQDAGLRAVMTEEGAQSSKGERAATRAALKRDKQRRGVGARALDGEVLLKDVDDFLWKRQEARLVAFAVHADESFGKVEISQLEGEHLAGAKSVEQHQADH